MSKPLVGICPNLKHVGEKDGYFLQPDYAAIVSEGGALPVILPFVANRQEAREFLERIDGVLLTGGPDIDPVHYGQVARDPERFPLAAPARTRSDFAYAQEAKDRGMALLGICLGIQSINVAFGGTLLQHIPDDVPTAMAHEGGAQHPIRIEPGTILARALGKESATVNSFHHQGIGELAPGFKVSARSPDDVIEAIERTDHPFFLGVSWHPERLTESDTTRRLLRAFVDATRGAWTAAS